MANKTSYLNMLPTGIREPMKKLFGSGATLTNSIVGNVTGDLTGNQSLALVAAEHSAVGCVGTGGFCNTYRGAGLNGDIITEIHIDITGLGCVGTAADDVIGVVSGTPVAYIGRYVVATYGVVYKAEMHCVEAPGEGTATITGWINVTASATATLDYDAAAGADQIIDSAAACVAGATYQNLLPTITANDYLYLTEGDTAATTGVYNAGQFIIRFYGHPVLTA